MSEVRNLWIPGPVGRLEAVLRVALDPVATAVVCHPHPLHGGTLHNPVVFHAERELHRSRMTTMRFNFRGTGSSTGDHDQGRGEVDDVAAAASWLRGLAPEAPMLLVGFSFGAWCALRHAISDRSIVGLIALGLPVRHYDYGDLQPLDRPMTVVQASDDEFGSPEEVRRYLDSLNPPGSLRVIPQTTHLFPQRARDAAVEVAAAAGAILPAGSSGQG